MSGNEGRIYRTNTCSIKKDEYDEPSWVRVDDRSMLAGNGKKDAMFIVSKNGNGGYNTIQSAIDAAERSNLRGRKVIHIREGVYRENIYVGPYNNDITLIGDGMRKTIITASRSVRSGYTTYNSATAGKISSFILFFDSFFIVKV